MTLTQLNTLPCGSAVRWNKKTGSNYGDRGIIAETPEGVRYIQWDDDLTLMHPDNGRTWVSIRHLKWVKVDKGPQR